MRETIYIVGIRDLSYSECANYQQNNKNGNADLISLRIVEREGGEV